MDLKSIETFHHLSSDHLPVLLRLGPFTGENHTNKFKKITDWKRVSTALEEVDTPSLNAIPNDIVSNKDIDTAIGALTNHIGTVVTNCQRKVPAKSKRRGLPADVRELIRVKNAALSRASAYPTPELRSRACALQREVNERVREFRNNKWSDLLEEISPSHIAYWSMTKALKCDGYVATSTLKKRTTPVR
ncbi:hypothetical protein EVAR_13794_1 [Eumeta japonica]|uniref:Uncharacterized protein n=1 Tax=Eumeta variegata TaxID=151549 RepID=A0A4C1U1C4_EUMVA|nr:hypothetical protein EVAR_13794_1 [Eumeta japonica]